MDEKTFKRGTRNAWILTLLLLLLVAGLTWFTYVTNEDEVAPHWVQGDKEFVPASSPYGQGYPLPPAQAGPTGDQAQGQAGGQP